MKGYKALLDQSWLHNEPPMSNLLQCKIKFNQVLSQLNQQHRAAEQNKKKIKDYATKIQSKITKLINNLNNDIDSYLESYIHTFDSINIYKCACGFINSDKQSFANHSKQNHRKRYQKGSSHFLTLFRVPLKYDENILKLFDQINDDQTSSSSKQKTPNKFFKKQNPQDRSKMEQLTKAKSRAQSFNLKINKNNQKKKSTNIDQSQAKIRTQIQHFFCGECKKSFDNYKGYSVHFSRHDFIIHPDSSHIVVRKKNKNGFPLPIRSDTRGDDRFTCNCNPNSNYSEQEFVKHVMKWHKGIAPKK